MNKAMPYGRMFLAACLWTVAFGAVSTADAQMLPSEMSLGETSLGETSSGETSVTTVGQATLDLDAIETDDAGSAVDVGVDRTAEEIPEEILRTEIITEARSPLTGEPMSAADYAQLQATLDGANGTPTVSDDIRYLIFLLQFRRAIKPIVPFL
ncbi:MAG: hypothetical protein AAFU53_13775 [Cyanobacteria bacterium J06632_3]